MLTIRVESNDVSRTWLARDIVKTGLECSSLPKIHGVLKYTRPGLTSKLCTLVRATVVYAHNMREIIGEVGDDGPNYFCLIENGNDNPSVLLEGAGTRGCSGLWHGFILAERDREGRLIGS
jgi:hypothetical protein